MDVLFGEWRRRRRRRMMRFDDGAATASIDRKTEREQTLQNGVRRDWNYVHFAYIWSLTGLILQGYLFLAIDFVSQHNDCFVDIVILSTVATITQFFISYTIRNFGALAFATIMTTRQLVCILLSCVWFAHPLSVEQLIGAIIVFGSIYSKSCFRIKPKPLPSEQTESGAVSPPRPNA